MGNGILFGPPPSARWRAGAREPSGHLRAFGELSDAELRRVLRVPALATRVSAQRLRYAARLAARAPLMLRALVQSGACEWRAALRADLLDIKNALPWKLADLPAPDSDNDLLQ